MSKELSEVLNLFRNEQFLEAEKKCSVLLKKIKPNFELLNIYALILFKLERYEESIGQWNKTIQMNPNFYFGYNNLGNVFLLKKDLTEALKNYEKAIEIKSDYYQAIFNKGNVFFELNEFQKALKCYDQVISLKKDYLPAYEGKAKIFKLIEKNNDAINEWNNVISLEPFNENALSEKGDLLFDNNKLSEALDCYQRAYEINPDKPFLLGNIIHTKTKMCKWENIEDDLTKLKDQIKNGKKSSPPYQTLTVFDDPALHLNVAKTWVSEYEKNNCKTSNGFTRNNKKKIKIGYFSADFRTHAMGHLMVKMLELHNKKEFKLYGFYFGPSIKKDDELSERIISCFDEFIDIRFKNDLEVIEKTKEKDLDIAIDLMGFTGKQNRFGIFSYKCAPLQINFLGYPGTSGSKFMDYVVLDNKILCPENDQFFSEKFIILPDTYQPNDQDKKISTNLINKKDFGLPENSFIFGCFNSHQKILPKMFKSWMKILKMKKDSVLWLLKDNAFSEDNLKKEAHAHNIDPERLIFAKELPHEEHLSRLKFVDLFLDTFPYNAHTTCSDALRMGIPVLTMKGKSFASRVANSLLVSIDLPELVTENFEEYEKHAIKISNDNDHLKDLKKRVLKNKINSNIYKTDIFTKNFEDLLKKIFQNYIDKKPTKNFKL